VPFASGPVLRYVGLGRYATVGSTLYVGRRDVILIPDAFTTDLASVPRIFWPLLPPSGVYERAAVLHDFLCEALAGRQPMPDPRLSPGDVDGLFRRVMRECGVGFLTRWLMWTGVRWGAAGNPARRPGWWRDAPLVLLISAATLAATCAAVYGLDHAAHHLARLLF
jgi:hypothetical protein